MLFTIIRDFFVHHVFGGVDSSNVVHSLPIGRLFASGGGNAWAIDLNHVKAIELPLDDRGLQVNGIYGMADWLSTTSTIITLVVILICIAYFIRWIFKIVSNSILLR